MRSCFAATLDALAAHPGGGARTVSPQAIYDYIYFHMVPGPATMFAGTRRLPPGHCLVHREGQSVVRPYWEMRYVEDLRVPEEALAREFLGCIESAVRDAASGARCGTFLSGGTDSSTVTGFLSRISESPVDSFSIGFDAAGYDEMSYARIAAERYRTNHHEYYVTPADVAEAIPLIAAEYDQPFGNSSAVPTYFCARLARQHGVERLLGGDGGDELFGGNARYARQHVFALYERIPGVVRGAAHRAADRDLARATPAARAQGIKLRGAGPTADAGPVRVVQPAGAHRPRARSSPPTSSRRSTEANPWQACRRSGTTRTPARSSTACWRSISATRWPTTTCPR